MDGNGLLRILVEATGLPQESLENELTSLLSARGVSRDSVTLDDIREVLAGYLQDVLVQAKDSTSAEDF